MQKIANRVSLGAVHTHTHTHTHTGNLNKKILISVGILVGIMILLGVFALIFSVTSKQIGSSNGRSEEFQSTTYNTEYKKLSLIHI